MAADAEHDEQCAEEHDLLKIFERMDTPEGSRAEFIEGEIVVTPPPLGDHEAVYSLINTQVIRRAAVAMRISGHKGLALPASERCTRNYLIPDMTIVPEESEIFFGADSWMPPDGVLMVVEITSFKSQADRTTKRHCYAVGDIPLYLLVDRQNREITLFSDPDPGAEDYLQDVRVPFGKPVDLPEPFEFALDTSRFA